MEEDAGMVIIGIILVASAVFALYLMGGHGWGFVPAL